MKRVMFLSVCIVLCTALVASAAISYTVTKDTTPTGYDKINFKLTGVDGAQAGSLLQLLEGTWTAIGTSKIFLGDSQTIGYDGDDNPIIKTWPEYTAGSAGALNSTVGGKQSYVNIPTLNTDAVTDRTGSNGSGGYSTFTGGWYTTSAAIAPTSKTIANIFVTKGGEVSFTGQFGFSNNTNLYDYTISSVPEPGTLVLLVTGLIGVVAMWVRRRRA